MKIFRNCFLLLLFAFCGCRQTIVHNLSETEANKMLARLMENALDAQKEKQPDGKWSLSVPDDHSFQAIRFLSEHRLLKEETSLLPEKAGLMVSREEQRFRYERALSRELEGTLAGIAGVLQARVHLNLPVMDPVFGQNMDNSMSSASVLLVVSNENVNKAEIGSLIAGASGIPASAIAVMVSNGMAPVTRELDPQVSVSDSLTVIKEHGEIVEIQPSLDVAGKSTRKDLGTKIFLQCTSLLKSLPWYWVGILAGLAVMMVGVFRLVNRHEKIAM